MSQHAPQRRRTSLVVLLVVLTALALVLAALLSASFLVAVPFTVIAAYAAWVGLSAAETLDAWGAASGDDVGRGPAGLSL